MNCRRNKIAGSYCMVDFVERVMQLSREKKSYHPVNSSIIEWKAESLNRLQGPVDLLHPEEA